MNKNNKIFIRIKYIFSRFDREYYIYAFFLIFAFFIVLQLFSFTVINHDYYKTLASKQQNFSEKELVSRWNIYSSNDTSNILATNVYLQDLAIDPSIKWNKEKLKSFLTDVVYRELCYLQSLTDCKRWLQKFLWVLDLPDFSMDETYLRDKIEKKIIEKISRRKVTSVLVFDNLTNEESFEIEKLNLVWIYVSWTNVFANPEEIIDSDFVAWKLSKITWKSKDIIKNKLKRRDLRYVLIISKLSISTSDYIKEKLEEEKQAFERWFLLKQDLISDFLILKSNYHRYYPEKQLASQIVWFVDNSWIWRYWIEWYYDDILRWKETKTFAKKDIQWRIIDPLSFTKEKELSKWSDIFLTIDKNIQKAVEDIINEDVLIYDANSISVIVMDPKTWYILSMATSPSFDPNNPGESFELEKVTPWKYPNPSIDLRWKRVLAVDNRVWDEYIYDWKKIYLREIKYEEFEDPKLEKYVFVNGEWAWVYKNHVISDIYEPWSIFKPLLMASWIDSWEINRYDMYQDNWYVKIDQFTIKNVSDKCLWYHSFSHAMNFSCNVWMIRIAQKLGKTLYYKYLDTFWFWKKTGISLVWEADTKLDPPDKWSKAKLFTSSYWLWIWVNMLQMASAYSVLANWWIYYKPQIVRKIRLPSWKEVEFKPEATHRVLKEETSRIMTEVLVDWVNNWVANSWKVDWYNIAWKTWTAQISYKWKYETWQASTIASFAWYWPAEDPKFVVVVKVERPRSSEWWSATAWRTFNRIVNYLLNYYAIPPKK